MRTATSFLMVLFVCAVAAQQQPQPVVTRAAMHRYSDPKHGISLEYPADWRVMEGDLGEVYGLGYLGPIPMDFASSGGIRIVTVSAPGNAHPGTDFGTAFITVSIDRHLSEKQCQQFSPEFELASKPIPSARKISGINFQGVTLGIGGAGHQFGGRYYHGFFDGVCYEVGIGLATAGYGAVEGLKPINPDDVFARLDSILQSVVIDQQARVSTALHTASSPEITAQIQERELNQHDDWWSIDIKYPEIEGAEGFNMAVLQHVTAVANDFRKELPRTASKSYPDYGAYLKGTFRVQVLKNSVVSTLFTYDESTPGAVHPWGVMASINYDTRARRVLALSDLFRPHSHYVSHLSKISIESLNRREYAEEAHIRLGAGPVESNFKVFTMTDTELVLHFQQYQVAAGAAGEPEPVVIPMTTLAPLLQKPYKPAQRE